MSLIRGLFYCFSFIYYFRYYDCFSSCFCFGICFNYRNMRVIRNEYIFRKHYSKLNHTIFYLMELSRIDIRYITGAEFGVAKFGECTEILSER